MKVYVAKSDFNKISHVADIELCSIEDHDIELINKVAERLKHYRPQIVDDIGLCVSATLIDFFEHITKELKGE